jgi:hypothetical protein
MTEELEHILNLIQEAKKSAEPGTSHYLILAARYIEAAIEYRKEKEQ